MRSRSMLFLALGIAVAASFGGSVPLLVAENGFISLNVPLTYTRMGNLATRTTHPHFIALYREILAILGVTNRIDLPYRFQTKGRMLSAAKDQSLLRRGTPLTISCAHAEAARYRGFSPETPCGYCVPCIIRRAAVATAGLDDREHQVDVRTSPPAARTKSGRDLRAFKMAIERFSRATPTEIRVAVSQGGPLPPTEFRQYIETFRNGVDEVRAFLTIRV